MLFVAYLALCVAVCFANEQPVVIFTKEIGRVDEYEFEKWSVYHNRTYANAEDEMLKLKNFADNLRSVHAHNHDEQQTWKMEMNKFSDMSFAEFEAKYLMKGQDCSATKGNHIMSGKDVPGHKDWRNEGKYVTPVKNQKSCGSCWTFSTTGCLESATAIHTQEHTLYSLSEQQLVDCAQAFDNHGCEGGLPSQAFEYIRYNHGLMTEASYPYLGKDEKCKFDPNRAVALVKAVVNITQNDEDQLVDAVAFHNPVSVAFQVTGDFQKYKSGVYSSTKCGSRPDQVNHAVLVVGYGTDAQSGMKYWIVKNSWGSDWGINGYFLIERGRNMCGIATCASYPVV